MPDPVHDTEASGRLFRQWQLYRKVIACDYMGHRGIHAALRQDALRLLREPFRLLDLGCGDASGVRETFRDTQLRDYVGVDLSEDALTHAGNFLAGAPFNVELVADDFFHRLGRTIDHSFEAAMIGHALHHLHSGEKHEFLRQCHRVLKPGGVLWVYDLFRLPGQDRDEWLVRVDEFVRHEWTECTPDEIALLIEHVGTSDFPERTDEFPAMAAAAGFAVGARPLFQTPAGYYALFGFRR